MLKLHESNTYFIWTELKIFCSDEPNAESECETAINKAIEADGENPEAYQLKASFYLSKDNKQVVCDNWLINKMNVDLLCQWYCEDHLLQYN